MSKISNAMKFVWKKRKGWLITTVCILVVMITISLLLTQNTLIYGTLKILFGGERRVLVSGDPTKYQYYTADADDFLSYETDSKFDSKAETLKEANKLNQLIAEEGFVLLKNDNKALPIETPVSNSKISARPKISIFGKNSVNLVYGGSGSGNGDTKTVSTIYESMTAAGYDCNTSLKDFYNSKSSGSGRSSNPDMGDVTFGLSTGETPQSSYTSAVKNSYAAYNDAAVVVISRIGGEGFDLPRTALDEKGKTLSSANEGDHYLELDKNEKALLTEVCSKFPKVVVVINSAATMELGFLTDGSYDNIDAAIWIASPGGSGINALGEIINGKVNPSGRTVDTYAKDFTLDPTWNNIGNNNVADGNRYTIGVGGTAVKAYFVDYEESIYVGYRYYETRAYMQQREYDDYEWYDNHVVYPFGYGLSYSSFTWEIEERQPVNASVLTKDGTIEIKVKVTNTGDRAGKDVVQMYYTAPYRIVNNKGQVEKAHVVLGDYAKTKMISPNGGTDIVTLKLKVSDMASYDYNDANLNNNKGYELDIGNYNIRIGRNAHDAWTGNSVESTTYGVGETFIYNVDSNSGTKVENRFDEVSSHIKTYLSRENFESTKTTKPTREDLAVSTEFVNSLNYNQAAYDEKYGKNYTVENMPTTNWRAKEGETAYNLYDVIQFNEEDGSVFIDYNDEKWDNILNQLTIEEMSELIGKGDFKTKYIESIDKPMTTDPDGPAGFTNFMGDPSVYETCFYASECVIGATWNKDLVHDMGVMVGNEGIIGNVKGDGRPYSGWYAPAVNTHRSPFSGRNWEYYSEDPVLSGKMGAEVVKGAKKKGVYTYVKHFALNDQETDRDNNGLITWANEQTMREIYLKPFEIIVKEGDTTAMMSSFNRIGTTWAGGSYELLTEVLRNEWGFKGIVITDYNLNTNGFMPVDQMIRAGGDLNLFQDGKVNTKDANATLISLMRQASKNILYTVAGSNAMNGMGEGNVYAYKQPLFVTVMIWIDVAIVVALAVWGFFAIWTAYKKKDDGLKNNEPKDPSLK